MGENYIKVQRNYKWFFFLRRYFFSIYFSKWIFDLFLEMKRIMKKLHQIDKRWNVIYENELILMIGYERKDISRKNLKREKKNNILYSILSSGFVFFFSVQLWSSKRTWEQRHNKSKKKELWSWNVVGNNNEQRKNCILLNWKNGKKKIMKTHTKSTYNAYQTWLCV